MIHFKNLLCEQGNNVSLGRTAFWLLFGIVLYIAAKTGVVSDSLMYLTTALLAYNLGKKFPIISKNGTQEITPPTP